jgi:hypothetical protein
MAGVRSHHGDGDNRMKSRGVAYPTPREVKKSPNSHIKRDNYIRVYRACPLVFPLESRGKILEIFVEAGRVI